MATKLLTTLFSRDSPLRVHSIATLVPFLLLIGLVFAQPVRAIPLAKLDSGAHTLFARQEAPPLPDGATDTPDCAFTGDEDMYGFGIRLGYYIQWVATVFGAYFTPKVVSSAFEANAIFNIGMLAGLIFSTIKRNNMHVVEPLIVLGFSIGGAVVGLLDPKNVHDPKNLKSIRQRLAHLCGTGALSLPLIIYWTWYSYYGMDTLSRESECPAYTFIIVKVNVWAVWFRYFMKVATVLALVGFLALAIAVIFAYRMKSNVLPHPPMESTFDFSVNPPPRLSRTATALMLRARPTGLQFIIVIFVCIICALAVELSIHWNNIQGVNELGATGQLIPMAIGIITSIRVVLGILGQQFKSRKTARKERNAERILGRYSGRMRGDETIQLGPGGGVVVVEKPQDPASAEKTMAEVEEAGKEKEDVMTVTTRPKMTPSNTDDTLVRDGPSVPESRGTSMTSGTRNKLKRKSLVEGRSNSS